MNYTDKLTQARARHGKSFACDPNSTFRYRRDRTILDDWMDSLREQRTVAQAEVPGLLREQAI